MSDFIADVLNLNICELLNNCKLIFHYLLRVA